VRVVMQTGDEVRILPPEKGTLFRLVGTKGLIEFWGRESAYLLVNSDAPGGRICKVEKNPKKHHHAHLDMLAGQIDAGKPDYTIPESSLAALELCEAAYLSSRWRCRIDLSLSSFKPPPPNDWLPGQPYSGKGGGRDGRKLPPAKA